MCAGQQGTCLHHPRVEVRFSSVRWVCVCVKRDVWPGLYSEQQVQAAEGRESKHGPMLDVTGLLDIDNFD